MKFTFTDILFMVFVGPIPPSMFSTQDIPEEPPTPLEVPESKADQTIPILFGKRVAKRLILTWYGDVAIKKIKVDSGAKK